MGELEDRIYEEIVVTEDGRSSCPAEDCNWWVPQGMEYLFLDHYTEHEELEEQVNKLRKSLEN